MWPKCDKNVTILTLKCDTKTLKCDVKILKLVKMWQKCDKTYPQNCLNETQMWHKMWHKMWRKCDVFKGRHINGWGGAHYNTVPL